MYIRHEKPFKNFPKSLPNLSKSFIDLINNHFQHGKQGNVKKVCNLAPKTSLKTSPKPIQKSVRDQCRHLSFLDPPKSRFCVYIYSILAQSASLPRKGIGSILDESILPGLTLEREARLIGEAMLL